MPKADSSDGKKREPLFTAKRGNVIIPGYLMKDGRICVAYREVIGGTRKRETFVDEKKARARAAEIATKVANGQADVLDLTGADRESYTLARQHCDAAGIPLHVAVQEWVTARKILAGHSLVEAANFYHRGYITKTVCPKTTVIIAELMNQVEDRRRDSKYVKDLKQDLDRFALACPDISAATEESLRAYLRGLRTKPTRKKKETRPIGPRRRDNVRDAIVRLFRFARDKEYLPHDRTSAAEKIERYNPGTEIATYTPEVLAILLANIREPFLPWMVLGAFAGLRTSEIWRLDWSAIKWGHKAIAVPRVVAKKVRVSRLVPMSANLLAWLSRYRHATGPIFPQKPTTLKGMHDRELARLKKATGIKWNNNALRHSFGSYRLAIIKSIDQVALEMGNSPAKIRENYNDPKPEAEAQRYFGLIPPAEKGGDVIIELNFAATN